METHAGQHYCSRCGQKTSVNRLSFHDIIHDVIHYITHADKSILSLLKQMFKKPGVVAREYIAGKRQKYFRPLNFFLIVAAVVVFMTSSFYKSDDNRSTKLELQAQTMANAEQKKRMLETASRIKTVSTFTEKYSNVIYMMAVPFLSLLFWLFYRTRFNYIESLVANMYITGFTLLLYALLVVPLRRLIPGSGFILLILFFLFEIIYRGWAYSQLENRKGMVTLLKAYSVSTLISGLWAFSTYSLIAYYIKNGF